MVEIDNSPLWLDGLPGFNSEQIDHLNPSLHVLSFLLLLTRPWQWLPQARAMFYSSLFHLQGQHKIYML